MQIQITGKAKTEFIQNAWKISVPYTRNGKPNRWRRRLGFKDQDRDEAAAEKMVRAFNQHYGPYWQRWQDWCAEQQLPPTTMPSGKVPAKMKVTEWTLAEALQACKRTIWLPYDPVKEQGRIKSIAENESAIRLLTKWRGNTPINEINHEWLLDLAEDMRNGELEGREGRYTVYKEGTVKRRLDDVRACLHECHYTFTDEEGNPRLKRLPRFEKFKLRNFLDRVVSVEEEYVIYEAIEKRMEAEPDRGWRNLKARVVMSIDTGARQGELKQANSKWIKQSAGKHYLSIGAEFTKNGKAREIILTQRVIAELAYLNAAAKGDKWFDNDFWYMWSNIRDDVRKMERADSLGNLINIDDVRLHTFRHTCATRLLRSKKMAIELVSEWLGHSDIKITLQRYAHLLTEDRDHGAPILDSYHQVDEPTPTVPAGVGSAMQPGGMLMQMADGTIRYVTLADLVPQPDGSFRLKDQAESAPASNPAKLVAVK